MRTLVIFLSFCIQNGVCSVVCTYSGITEGVYCSDGFECCDDDTTQCCPEGMSPWAIAGTVIGCVTFAALLLTALCIYRDHRLRNRRRIHAITPRLILSGPKPVPVTRLDATHQFHPPRGTLYDKRALHVP
ncbi:hypothetical protein MAR_010198 [Mya arenaria]|uniref:Uncharacterized protein n=1 Tax=Mya arenaria TaxID=6604 RepID=A0ABY7E3W5_MYAAR|nr:uncharacterized protein LOC128232871 [Mya arenaria]WAR03640.1 hypothetical protein MAR_010198 [Mya arenaria]